jgi:hypothetical protein
MIEYRQAHLKSISHCLSLQKAHSVYLSLSVNRFPASPESLSLEFMSVCSFCIIVYIPICIPILVCEYVLKFLFLFFFV